MVVTSGCPSTPTGHIASNAGTLACRTQASRRAAGSISTLRRSEQPYSASLESSAAAGVEQQQDWGAVPSNTLLPKLQPISRALARELQREQHLSRRLRQQISLLQRQLVQCTDSHSRSQSELVTNNPSNRLAPSSNSSSSSSSSSSVELYEDWNDDPLFSAATPPSVEQLQRKLVHVQRQLRQASSESLADVMTVTSRLQEMASCLELPLDLLVLLVARHEPLLLQPLQQLPPRLSLLSSALQLPPRDAAQLLASSAPQLLAMPLQKLQSNLTQLQRVLSSRGLDANELLQDRPDLLAQAPASVEAKLEQLPGALGMSRQHVRQLVAKCPQLLRRSVFSLQHRYRALCGLFAIPDSFVEELVLQEPTLLCVSAAALKAKFDSLLVRYGAFSDDVVDMVLVDPSMLLNADPATAPRAPTVKASRKKQAAAAAAAAAAALQDSLPGGSSPADSFTDVHAESAGAVQVADISSSSSSGSSDSGGSAGEEEQQQQQQGLEPWQLVLLQRQEKQRAARQRQQLRRRMKQQQWETGGDAAAAAADAEQHQEQLVLQPGSVRVGRQSPVRQLLAFASATGLSTSQALQLWQQEPALAQLPTALVAAQVTRLAAALGLDSPAAAAAIAASNEQQQQQQQQQGAPAGVWQSGTGSSIRPVLQVLVKEPALLILPPGQLQVNMRGLADLLSLDLRADLMPLLWQQPGLLQLAPEVAEYRLQHLAGLLQLSVPKTLNLVLQQPRLLVERPVLLAARLGSLCTLLSVQRGVAAECALREPLLLCVDDDSLQQGWLQLCGRVGGWAPDAVDVVLADPAALLRGGF